MEFRVAGRETATRLLIEHQADVSSKGNDRGTALFPAACGGIATVARLQIDLQADVAAEIKHGSTALQPSPVRYFLQSNMGTHV